MTCREQKQLLLTTQAQKTRDVVCVYAPLVKDRLFWKTVEPLTRTELGVMNTTRNELILPKLMHLFESHIRFLLVEKDPSFIPKHIGQVYHLEQRWVLMLRVTRSSNEYSMFSNY